MNIVVWDSILKFFLLYIVFASPVNSARDSHIKRQKQTQLPFSAIQKEAWWLRDT